ncbi:MAG: aminoglycoside phosphotransferase family protein [Lapillicoccus sp.]
MSDASALVPQPFADRVATYPLDPLHPRAGYAVTGAEWLRRLPRLLGELLEEWRLTPTGVVGWGYCAVVVAVDTDAGPAVLKVSWPHHEAVSEHLALRHWDGHGAVRLLRADPHRFALLLERLDPTDLCSLPDEEACEVVGTLLDRLRAPAIARTPTLSAYVTRQLEKPPPLHVLPRRFVDQGRRLAAELASEPGVDAYLLHSDLHYENVLRGERQPWLAIDPKPMAGDRAFEVAPVLWNRVGELGTGSAFRWNVRRRLEVVCAGAGIDEDRAKAWTIVREVDNAGAEPPGSPGASLAVALIKAMND